MIDDALTDRWRRRIRYLRVSVTDRCNYRCSYCMPVEGFPQVARAELLSLEEIGRFVEVMAGLGVERVRITGGEPLVRKGVVDLVRTIAATPGIRQVAMTTNGELLSRFAGDLHEAGLRGLNVSLDTFDEGRFAAITRGGSLDAVLEGLAAADAAGFEDIRVNAVAVAGVNDDQIVDFTRRCWDGGWMPRFIELMPVGGLDFQVSERAVSMQQIIRAFEAELPVREEGRLDDGMPRGPARYWVVTAGPYAGRKVGIISPMTDHGFCEACNRARLTARGGLRACLANDDEVSILHAVRSGASRAALTELVREAVHGKLEAHRMTGDFIPLSIMTGIGG